MLRFTAALMVTLFHLNQAIIPVHNWYRNTINNGWLGVPVFFVISGYCIIASAHYTKEVRTFLIKRFFRIFPPYWLSLAIVFSSAIFQKLYTGTNSVHNLPNDFFALSANLTLTTAPFSKIDTINWVYWSLTCEVAFYLLIGLAMVFNKKYLTNFLIAISIVSALAAKQDYGLLFFLDHWPAFGLGVSIYYFFKIPNWRGALNFSLLLILNSFSLYHKHTDRPEYLTVALITSLLVYFSIRFPVKENIFAKLGKHSYSVYLIHVPVGVFIIGVLESEQIKTTPYLNLVYDLCIFSIISLLAYGIYALVETPLIKYGNKLTTEKTKSTPVNKVTV